MSGRWADAFVAELDGVAGTSGQDLGRVRVPFGDADVQEWVTEFQGAVGGRLKEELGGLGEAWAEQFSKLNMEEAWGGEHEGADGTAVQGTGYRFHAENPFLGDAGAREKGERLLREGLLTEVRGEEEGGGEGRTADRDTEWEKKGEGASMVDGRGEGQSRQSLSYLVHGSTMRWNRAFISQSIASLIRTTRCVVPSLIPGHMTFCIPGHNGGACRTCPRHVRCIRQPRRASPQAVLAFEAVVRADPADGESWRLLGRANAENDDDGQSIAAMRRALESAPASLAVLMSLGVSHTNELDAQDATRHLREWLRANSAHR